MAMASGDGAPATKAGPRRRLGSGGRGAAPPPRSHRGLLACRRRLAPGCTLLARVVAVDDVDLIAEPVVEEPVVD